jgi:hypothetical protein
MRIVLFQNGSYASSGGQPLGGADNLSFATVAKGAGFPFAVEVRTEQETGQALAELFRRSALGFVAVHVERDISPGEPPGLWSQAEERAVFMRSLMR